MKRTHKNRYTSLGKSYTDKLLVKKYDNINTIITIVLSLIAIVAYFLPCMTCTYDSSDLQSITTDVVTSVSANSFKAIGTIASCYDIWQVCVYVYATTLTLISLSITLILALIIRYGKKDNLAKLFEIFKYITAGLGIVYIVSIILSTVSSSGSFIKNYEYISFTYSVEYGAIIITACCIAIGLATLVMTILKSLKLHR